MGLMDDDGTVAGHKHRGTVIDKKIGARLRLLRTQRRLSQEQLGKALGVTFQQIQKYERGSNAIASTRVPRLCEVLKIKPNDLFSGFTFESEPTTDGAFALRLATRVDQLGKAPRRTFTAFVDFIEGINSKG
jgi:transcriptional regulator with XRE-family HTH domain